MRVGWGKTVNNIESGAKWRFPILLPLNTVFKIGVLASLTFGAIEPAVAEGSGLVERYAVEHTAGRPEKPASPDPLSSGPLFAVVSIADQRISVYGSGGLLARSPVSTGVPGHATPTGVFSIVQKRRWHESNIYSSAPMPFMQRITWSGIALHAGVVPGRPASHGCIRLPASFAQRLFGATVVGQRVIVAPSDTAPIEITHKTLPVPKMSPAPGVAVSSASGATASISTPQQNSVAVLEPASLHDAPAGAGLLNPLEFARAMKIEANSRARAAGQANRAAMLLIARKTTELRLAARKLASAEHAAEDAADELSASVRRIGRTDGKEAIADASEAKDEAEAALAEAVKVKDARMAKAMEAKTRAEAALIEVQKAIGDARIATASDTNSQAMADQAQALKPEELRIANAAEVKTDADAALTETRKAEELRIAKATEAKIDAEAALTETEKAEERRVARATEAKVEADAALTEAQQAEESRIAKATEAKSRAETVLTEAQKVAEEARSAKDAKEQELAAARKVVAEAKTASRAAMNVLAEATRRLKPLSVFISRKTGRLYVRQDFEPLFDAPVLIRDPDREIGTHIYVTTRATEDGSGLHWQAVSMPTAETLPARREGKSRRSAQDDAATPVAPPAAMAEPETAQGALDRMTIPEDTSQRLGELAWIGASVIVSDYGISGETGATTDFIILTKTKPSSR